MKRIIRHIAPILTVVIFASFFLSGCGIQFDSLASDPVADEYLEDMLDAIRENDVDTAYDMFADGYVDYDEMEKSMDTLSQLWTYDDYEYKLINKEVKTNMSFAGSVTYYGRKYKVTVDDDTFTVTLTYIKDEGLAGFHIDF